MASYVIFEQPGGEESPALVRDSFRWPAFVAPFLWFLWCGLWIEALLVFAVMALFVAIGQTGGFAALVICLAFFLSLALGFEASALQMAALRRRGWVERDVVDARDRGEAEIRYLSDAADLDESAPSSALAKPDRTAPAGAMRRRQPGLGLLDYPGGA